MSSIFLYNSELGISNKTIANKIDSFQRRQLRHVINIKWPRVLSNEELYRRTKLEKWSRVIKNRRLSWLGHLLHLNEDTPVRITLKEVVKKHPRKVGRSKTTLIDTIKNDLKSGGLKLNFMDNSKMFNDLICLCENRNMRRNEVKRMMLIDSTYM